MTEFKKLIEIVVYGIESFGVLVIVIGSLVASIRFLKRFKKNSHDGSYMEYRQAVGRAIILGIEFLIAGDVIRTVIVSHTLTELMVLAFLVVIRSFLSFTLTVEIEGRMPWQRRDPGGTV